MGGSGFVNGVEYPQFDNFYRVLVEIDGYQFPSSEHAYQALKFKNPEYIERIRTSPVGIACFLGCSKDEEKVDGWTRKHPHKDRVKDPMSLSQIRLMYRVNFEKFSQNNELKNVLLSTDGPIKFEASNPFWNKWNGWILEKIREDIRIMSKDE